MELSNKGKKYKKKADMKTKIGKYFTAKQAGKTKKEAQLVAGFADAMHSHRIEKTQTYQEIEKKFYADVLQEQITIKEIATEQVKVIKQDKDLGAKNAAIKQALEKIEPETQQDTPEKVLVVLR